MVVKGGGWEEEEHVWWERKGNGELCERKGTIDGRCKVRGTEMGMNWVKVGKKEEKGENWEWSEEDDRKKNAWDEAEKGMEENLVKGRELERKQNDSMKEFKIYKRGGKREGRGKERESEDEVQLDY